MSSPLSQFQLLTQPSRRGFIWEDREIPVASGDLTATSWAPTQHGGRPRGCCHAGQRKGRVAQVVEISWERDTSWRLFPERAPQGQNASLQGPQWPHWVCPLTSRAESGPYTRRTWTKAHMVPGTPPKWESGGGRRTPAPCSALQQTRSPLPGLTKWGGVNSPCGTHGSDASGHLQDTVLHPCREDRANTSHRDLHMPGTPFSHLCGSRHRWGSAWPSHAG